MDRFIYRTAYEKNNRAHVLFLFYTNKTSVTLYSSSLVVTRRPSSRVVVIIVTQVATALTQRVAINVGIATK